MTIQILTEELNRKMVMASARGELSHEDVRALMDLMSNILTVTPTPRWLEAYTSETKQ